MKLLNHVLLILLFFCTLASAGQSSDSGFNPEYFKNPPTSVHVHTWWHWIDGRITREGITKDLESMKHQGISQATILNVGMSAGKDLGVEQSKFGTGQWYSMFEWVLHEARRLGITIGIHNCDGWSESGGPWITPETSMKKFVFRKTTIGSGQQKIQIQQPDCETSFYRDVAVVAFRNHTPEDAPQPPKRISFNDTINGNRLIDGDPQSMMEVRKNDRIKIAYNQANVKSKIAILHNFKGAFYFPGPKKIRYTLKASDDDINYRKIADFETTKFYTTEIISFPETQARFFTIELGEIANLRPWHHAAIAELELLNKNEQPAYHPSVLYPLEKTASARIINPDVLFMPNSQLDSRRIIPEDSVIDLSGKMSSDGTLNWEVPAGYWTIIRFGYTTTGAENGPATAEGRGLECDKLDTAAVNLHFRSFPKKVIEHAGKYKGNTFKFFMIDSWERGYQTWTRLMPEEFASRRGYSLIRWIPVLCGETVASAELSDGFLYDFRKTIAELFEQNYYRHFSELCHQNKLGLHGEVMYGDIGPFPPIDVLRTNSYMDMPMFEFWAEQNKQSLVKYTPSGTLLTNFPAYAANFYHKPVIGAEAYTGFAHYSESPSDLKLFGDKAYCSGITQMILHSYVHQPADKMPGLTLGQHGSHFNRNNPEWQYYRGWMDYQSRIQYLLQKGKTSADILYFMGDQLPQFLGNKIIQELPKEYRAIPCNLDVLKKLTVDQGKLKFDKKQTFRLLVLPDQAAMEFESLQVIEQLVKNGAIVYGHQPQQMLSLSGRKNDQQKFRELAGKIWNSASGTSRSHYGKGLVIHDEPIAGVLSDLLLIPEFTTHQTDSLNLMYIHKNTGHMDVFFVVNQQDSLLKRTCSFRVSGKIPEIWNPLTGEINRVTTSSEENGQLLIPVTFQPRESLFFIFREGNTKRATSNPDVPQITEIKDFKGIIHFHPINSGKPDSISITNFKSFTEYSDPAIKYFAGTASYRIDFELPYNYINDRQPVFLKFGKLDASAKVWLNGRFLGNLWMPDMQFRVTQLLKAKNHLEIKLATTCRNRIIGDFIEYGTLQNIWTSAPVNSFLSKESPLKSTGFMGSLQLIKYYSKQK